MFGMGKTRTTKTMLIVNHNETCYVSLHCQVSYKRSNTVDIYRRGLQLRNSCGSIIIASYVELQIAL